MKNLKVKGFWGVFLNPLAGLAIALFPAIICIPSFIAGIGNAKANGRLTLLTAPITATVSQPPLNKPEIKAAYEQAGEWQTVQMCVTAYCPCPKCCGRYSDGKTACGYKIRPGDTFLAADKKYPFGTEMIVPGYKNGEPVKVLDRGGAIRGNRLDVFFHSHKEAKRWGVRFLDVKVRCK